MGGKRRQQMLRGGRDTSGETVGVGAVASCTALHLPAAAPAGFAAGVRLAGPSATLRAAPIAVVLQEHRWQVAQTERGLSGRHAMALPRVLGQGPALLLLLLLLLLPRR